MQAKELLQHIVANRYGILKDHPAREKAAEHIKKLLVNLGGLLAGETAVDFFERAVKVTVDKHQLIESLKSAKISQSEKSDIKHFLNSLGAFNYKGKGRGASTQPLLCGKEIIIAFESIEPSKEDVVFSNTVTVNEAGYIPIAIKSVIEQTPNKFTLTGAASYLGTGMWNILSTAAQPYVTPLINLMHPTSTNNVIKPDALRIEEHHEQNLSKEVEDKRREEKEDQSEVVEHGDGGNADTDDKVNIIISSSEKKEEEIPSTTSSSSEEERKEEVVVQGNVSNEDSVSYCTPDSSSSSSSGEEEKKDDKSEEEVNKNIERTESRTKEEGKQEKEKDQLSTSKLESTKPTEEERKLQAQGSLQDQAGAEGEGENNEEGKKEDKAESELLGEQKSKGLVPPSSTPVDPKEAGVEAQQKKKGLKDVKEEKKQEKATPTTPRDYLGIAVKLLLAGIAIYSAPAVYRRDITIGEASYLRKVAIGSYTIPQKILDRNFGNDVSYGAMGILNCFFCQSSPLWFVAMAAPGAYVNYIAENKVPAIAFGATLSIYALGRGIGWLFSGDAAREPVR